MPLAVLQHPAASGPGLHPQTLFPVVVMSTLRDLSCAVLLALAAACDGQAGLAGRAELSVSRVDFGDVPLPVPLVWRELELRAPAGAGLDIASIALQAPFTHDLSPAPLAPLECRRFRISLAPQDVGTLESSLTITFTGTGQVLIVPVGGRVVCVPYTVPVFGKSVLSGASPEAPSSLQ